MKMKSKSLLSYYQENQFNPVPIDLGTESAWNDHVNKRKNLYEQHLSIPLSLLRERAVLEFGCCSGENAIVLAYNGARLTLVEPNEQVLPRLQSLFQSYGFEKQIDSLQSKTIESFTSNLQYDIVIAEGFLFTLPNRDDLLHKIIDFMAIDGFTIVSFNDRYGSLIEYVKRLILWRAYQIEGIRDEKGADALSFAKRLFEVDFNKISASRPFDVWWKDTLINRFLCADFLWSYKEIFPILDSCGCVFYSSSPQWSLLDHFRWYKKIIKASERNKRILEQWHTIFPYILTGVVSNPINSEPASEEIVSTVSKFIKKISDYTSELGGNIHTINYPREIYDYLDNIEHPEIKNFNQEMKNLFEAIQTNHLETLINAYHDSKTIRRLWGTPYQYLCFTRQ